MTTRETKDTATTVRWWQPGIHWTWWGVVLGSLTVWGLALAVIFVAFGLFKQ